MPTPVNIEMLGIDVRLAIFVTGSPQPAAAIDSEIADSIAWKITGAQQHGVTGAPANPPWSDVIVMLDDGTDDSVQATFDEVRNLVAGDTRSVFIVSGFSWGQLRGGVRDLFMHLTAAPTDEVAMVLVLTEASGLPEFAGAARVPVVDRL